jgi:dipeptidyl aminopeptidase/acylaminoacyl peptidase
MHGTADVVVPYEQSTRLAAALRAVGVRCDLHPVPDAGHCFEGHPDIGGLIERCIDFLDEVLASRPGP